nr:YQAJ-like viral recombinase [Pandoravirus massiliensis]
MVSSPFIILFFLLIRKWSCSEKKAHARPPYEQEARAHATHTRAPKARQTQRHQESATKEREGLEKHGDPHCRCTSLHIVRVIVSFFSLAVHCGCCGALFALFSSSRARLGSAVQSARNAPPPSSFFVLFFPGTASAFLVSADSVGKGMAETRHAGKRAIASAETGCARGAIGLKDKGAITRGCIDNAHGNGPVPRATRDHTFLPRGDHFCSDYPGIHDRDGDDNAEMTTAAHLWPRPTPAESINNNNGDDDEDIEVPSRNSVSVEEKRAFLDRLKMTPAQIDEAENTPQRTQAWFGFRRDRLSASLFGGAAGHNKNETEEGVLKKMLWSSPFSNAATEYGTALEGAAFAAVQAGVASALQQRGFATVWFEETGTRVFADHPWLCASADGLVRAVDGPGGTSLAGVLELKAPYYKKAFYEPTPHYYYDQFSGQARIHNADFIVFGVYTPEGTQVNYFQRDAAYWDDVLFPALRAFYMGKYLWRAILRDRGRIEEPNIDPHPCINISRLDFRNHERVEAEWNERARREAQAQRERKEAAARDAARLIEVAVATPDPWEPMVARAGARPSTDCALAGRTNDMHENVAGDMARKGDHANGARDPCDALGLR